MNRLYSDENCTTVFQNRDIQLAFTCALAFAWVCISSAQKIRHADKQDLLERAGDHLPPPDFNEICTVS